MRRYRRQRKGFTLVELVLALTIMVLIASAASTLIGAAVHTRQAAITQSTLYAVSLRIHKAIATELQGAGEVCLYQTGPTKYSTVPEDQRVMYIAETKDKVTGEVSSRVLQMGNSLVKSAKLLPTTNGFESYNGVLVDSVTYRVMLINDYLNADTDNTSLLARCVQVTTTVSLPPSDKTYTHTSTIRFDEMVLYSNQVMVVVNTSSYTNNTFSPANNKIRVATGADKGTEFSLIRYSIA